MKRYLQLITLVILFILLLSSCGGGGGSSGGNGGNNGDPNITPTTKATITSGNAASLAIRAYSGCYGLIQPIMTDSGMNNIIGLDIYSALAQALEQRLRQINPLSQMPADGIMETDTTIKGFCPESPGTAQIVHYRDSWDWHYGNMIFSDYCLLGTTVSGSVAFSGVFAPYSGRIASVDYQLNNLAITQNDKSFRVQGDIICWYPGYLPSGQFCLYQRIHNDIKITDQTTGLVYEIRDVLFTVDVQETKTEIKLGCDDPPSLPGSFFDPQYGYVDLETITPLTLEVGFIYPSHGEFIIHGDNNTSAKMTILASGSFKIEADTNGDGGYDWDSGILYWSPGSPQVLTVNPAPDSKYAPIYQIVYAYFNKDMDPATINENSFYVSGVSGTVGYSGQIAYFIPLTYLNNNTTYTATITTAAKDTQGTALAMQRSWPFTTNPATRVYFYDFPINDSGFHPSDASLYCSSKDNRKVYRIDLNSGVTTNEYAFSYMPESIAIRPDNKKMYVSLLTREHDDYWWADDQEGYIAEFDLESQIKTKEFKIAIDPYNLISTSDGFLYVTSGSGQWANFDGYDINSGQRIGRVMLYQETRANLHPSEGYIYTNTIKTMPSSIEIFKISDGVISTYWEGDYRIGHWIDNAYYIHPSGECILTNYGDIIQHSVPGILDMNNFQRFCPEKIFDLAFDPLHGCIFTVEEFGIKCYDSSTYKLLGSIPLFITGRNFISLSSDCNELYHVVSDSSSALVSVIPVSNFNINSMNKTSRLIKMPAGGTIQGSVNRKNRMIRFLDGNTLKQNNLRKPQVNEKFDLLDTRFKLKGAYR